MRRGRDTGKIWDSPRDTGGESVGHRVESIAHVGTTATGSRLDSEQAFFRFVGRMILCADHFLFSQNQNKLKKQPKKQKPKTK